MLISNALRPSTSLCGDVPNGLAPKLRQGWAWPGTCRAPIHIYPLSRRNDLVSRHNLCLAIQERLRFVVVKWAVLERPELPDPPVGQVPERQRYGDARNRQLRGTQLPLMLRYRFHFQMMP